MRRSRPIQIYLAGPLFTQAEWQWNQHLKEELESRGVSVLLPQSRAEPMLAGRSNFNPTVLFKKNVADIAKAKAVVAARFSLARRASSLNAQALKARKPNASAVQ